MNVATLERTITSRRTKTFLEREFPSGEGAKFVTITPRVARELLASNPDNRTVSQTKVQHYASDMQAGRWVMNGESIIISADGQTNDGQHRLYGCIEADTPFDTLLCFGVPRETRVTVDQGKARSVGDYLSMSGTTNAKLIASTAKRALAFERSGGKNLETKYFTNAEVMAFAESHMDALATSSTYGNAIPDGFRYAASPGYTALWHYILKAKGELALEYLEQVVRGEGLRQLDPAYTVRNRLMAMGRETLQAKTESVLRGWIYYRDGKQLHRVQLMGTFPEL